jgi:predicted CXXCH cytochrome family protein
MTNAGRRLIIGLTGIGMTLIMAGLLPLVVTAQEGTPEPAPVGAQVYDLQTAVVEPTGDNSYCVVCHNQPLQAVTMQDGSILNLYVSPDMIASSAHGVTSETGTLGCIDCHGADSFPHKGPTPTDHRDYTLRSVMFCVGCHADEVAALQQGLHEQAILAGNTAAAVCTDCHGAHSIQYVDRFPDLVAGVCGDCHETTLAEWRSSAHVDIGPLDCATCHSPHSQRLRLGENSDDLCLNCHKNMPVIFTHEQHVSGEVPVTCVSCHMFVSQPQPPADAVGTQGLAVATGHTVQVETIACNTCHQQMVDSGEWTRLVGGADTLRAERDVLRERVSELEGQVEVAAEARSASDFVPLMQGLILGLGFGATVAAIFIARGYRRSAPLDRDEERTDRGSHDG